MAPPARGPGESSPQKRPERPFSFSFRGQSWDVVIAGDRVSTPEENREIARWIARKVNRGTAPVVILIPEKGVSMIDAPGQPFYDPAADSALFDELEACVHHDEVRRIVRLPYHINDKQFSDHLVDEFLRLQRK